MASVQAPALSMLETHLLLAASGHENFLIKLLDWRLLDGLCSNIAAFCSSSSISRTVHRVPSELAQTANRASDILQHFFVPAQKDNENGRQVAQVVVIPLLEVYPRHLQAAVKAVLRDKRFELEGQTFMIPKDFLLIGVSADWEGIAPYMIDVFGLSLELYKLPVPAPSIPPLIPLQPPAFVSPLVRVYAADLLSAFRHHSLLDNTLLTVRCSFQHLFKIATLYLRLNRYSGKELVYPTKIDITPADVLDILPSCILHRLRTRPPDQRWDTVWDHKPGNGETQRLDNELRNGAKLRYDLIVQEIIDKT